MGSEEPPQPDTRPLWLRNQQQTTFKAASADVIQTQLRHAKAVGGFDKSNAPVAPSNEGTGLSGWVVGAEAGALPTTEYHSAEISSGESKLKQMKLDEEAKTKEGIAGARARFKAIMNASNAKLYHAVIVLLVVGFLAYTFLTR